MARPVPAPVAASNACRRGTAVGLTSILDRQQFLPARRYASAGTSYGPMSVGVCHQSLFYRNG